MTQSPKFALFIRKELVRNDFKASREDIKYYINSKYDTNINWSADE